MHPSGVKIGVHAEDGRDSARGRFLCTDRNWLKMRSRNQTHAFFISCFLSNFEEEDGKVDEVRGLQISALNRRGLGLAGYENGILV